MSEKVPETVPEIVPETEQKQMNLADMNALQSLNLLYNLVNRAVTKGAFNLDESYVLKVAFEKIAGSLRELESKKETL